MYRLIAVRIIIPIVVLFCWPVLTINMIIFFNMFNFWEQFLNQIICQARWLPLQIIKTFYKAIQLSLLGSITLIIATTRLSSPSFNSHHAITPCFQWQGSVKPFRWNLSGVNAAMPFQSFYVVHCKILTLFV